MTNYKELVAALREETETIKAVEWDIPICTSNHIAEAADVIEQLAKELEETREDERNAEEYAWKVKQERDALAKSLDQTLAWYNNETVRADRLEAENRAKEQYIAETIGKVIKERDAAVADLKGHCRCSDCKHLDANNRCKENHSCFDANHWEWRGVGED